MYEQPAKWNECYSELDPKKRREMLETLCMTEPDDGANEYRLRLYKVRHIDEKSGREVDRFLFQCVNFIYLYNSSRLFRRSAEKEIRRTFKELLFEEASIYGEAGERALYWEIRNTALRYLSTCNAPGYNRAFFGLVRSNESGRKERICKDIWRMSRGLAQRVGLKDYMRVWNDAVVHAYLASYEGGAALLSVYASKTGSKLN